MESKNLSYFSKKKEKKKEKDNMSEKNLVCHPLILPIVKLLACRVKITADNTVKYSDFTKKIGFDISCKLSP